MISLTIEKRPQKLSDIAGNKDIIKYLTNAIKENNVPHSLIIIGPYGCGKTTIARCLANELGVSGPSLLEFNSANTNGIDTTRAVEEECQHGMLFGEKRIFIFDESQQLTQAAQQSLFKVIEEPSPGTYFFFCTTDPQSIHKAIHSRCIHLSVCPLNEEETKEFLTLMRDTTNFLTDISLYCQLIHKITEGVPRAILLALDKIRNIKEPEEIINSLIEEMKKQEQVERLFQTVISRASHWGDIINEYKKIEDKDSEKMRRRALAYYGACFKNDACFYQICDSFTESTFYTGETGFLLQLYRAYNAKRGV